MKCENCQNEFTLTKTQKYHYIQSGLENVFLDNIKIYSCAECDVQIPVIPKILKLHALIGNAIVCKASLLSGAETKFLRKSLGVKAQDWAKLLRSKKETISRWENELQAISPQSDLLIRYLYLRLREEKNGVRLEGKIAESLSEITSQETAIIIDVAKMETYSYSSLDETLNSAKATDPDTFTFGFELDQSNMILSEIEHPLTPDVFTHIIERGSFPDKTNWVTKSRFTANGANRDLAMTA